MSKGPALILVGCAIIALVLIPILYQFQKPVIQGVEGFLSGSFDAAGADTDKCPASVTRNDKGEIVLHPGGRTFSTLAEYSRYMQTLLARGEPCVALQVPADPRDKYDTAKDSRAVLGATPDLARRDGGEYPMPGELIGKLNGMDHPYSQRAILKLADYEGTDDVTPALVEDSESPDIFNRVLQENALDWARLPPNSVMRAAEQTEMEARRVAEDAFTAFSGGKADTGSLTSGELFKALEGADVLPKEDDGSDEAEQVALMTFQPQSSDPLKEYTVDEIEALLKRMYKDKPYDFKVEKVGQNQFRMTTMILKDEKVTWEDNVEPQGDGWYDKWLLTGPPKEASGASKEWSLSGSNAGEDETMATKAALPQDQYTALDPYYDKRKQGHALKLTDYRKWTAGLERMFAPTGNTVEWQ